MAFNTLSTSADLLNDIGQREGKIFARNMIEGEMFVSYLKLGQRPLRIFTLPGHFWHAEKQWAMNGEVKFEEFVGAEMDSTNEGKSNFRKHASALRKLGDHKVTPIYGFDRSIYLGTDSLEGRKAMVTKGFDMMWLDYCCGLSWGTWNSLLSLSNRSEVFLRPLMCGVKGILCITLQLGQEPYFLVDAARNSRLALEQMDSCPWWQVDERDLSPHQKRVLWVHDLLNYNWATFCIAAIPSQTVYYRGLTKDGRYGSPMAMMIFSVVLDASDYDLDIYKEHWINIDPCPSPGVEVGEFNYWKARREYLWKQRFDRKKSSYDIII